jgi:hypothetical protein
VPISAETAKPNATRFVWPVRSRPKLNHGIPKFSSGQTSSAAAYAPAIMPRIAQTIEQAVNAVTIRSS